MKRTHLLFLLPALTVLLAFFVLPVLRLLPASVSTDQGILLYAEILTNPRYASSLFSTVVLSLLVTIASVALGAFTGIFLERNDFPGRSAVVGLITLPLSFPGVVVGFMIIMLGGRNGMASILSSSLGAGKLVFAYGMAGLFFFSTGALCFATSMGAFGTAFTLATDINVLPITIYTEFTLSANIAAASMLAVVLGLITWGILLAARLVSVPNER